MRRNIEFPTQVAFLLNKSDMAELQNSNQAFIISTPLTFGLRSVGSSDHDVCPQKRTIHWEMCSKEELAVTFSSSAVFRVELRAQSNSILIHLNSVPVSRIRLSSDAPPDLFKASGLLRRENLLRPGFVMTASFLLSIWASVFGPLSAAYAGGVLGKRTGDSNSACPVKLPLNNRYFLVRHGQSKANVEGIILSDPLKGISPRWGLSDVGKEQAREAAKKLLEIPGSGKWEIYTSDFRRAQETAEIIQKEIGGEIHVALELRERFFGELEGTPTMMEKKAGAKGLGGYPAVWAEDEKDASSRYKGTESVVSVYARALSLVQFLEKAYKGKRILLASHGDTIQILQCGMAGDDLRNHRKYFVNTAEVRELKPSPNCLTAKPPANVGSRPVSLSKGSSPPKVASALH
mmetsp:Transcript_41387/g.67149  ORF Transcript_41387/g.67149 Transcript_41387/m.67149 type:complete len:405 (-) Transcript_41387:429-1643(-)|eukprot:CAMPEP_0184656014 /NCGR_PEP_ID=MMETSP0308-20130426/15361_1 /TAXON_ID=38269 /ORGANISM="Gloeochaete witrockiana, Strain SAG 46.84" /LENGTH=404 /DNA_ID=CAMNT_0027092907 /DNA_START=38 /DNA_END=1252 /DNA_ORIENTATION=-